MDEAELMKYARGGMPVARLAERLGRTETAVRAKAAQLQISLKPPKYSPYSKDFRRK